MASDKHVLKNLLYALGGYRLSKDSNNFRVNFGAASQEASCYEDEADRHAKGTRNSPLSLSGYLTEREVYLISQLNDESTTLPFTVCLSSATSKPAGTFAIVGGVQLFNLDVGGDRGVVAPFSGELQPDEQFHGFAAGQLLYNNVGGAALAATGNGTGLNLGAIGAGKVGIFAFHVVDPPGIEGTTPTLDGIVASDADNTWASPITRVTFAQVTTVPGGQLAVIDGDATPITDAWWRAGFTVGGTDPEYTVLMAAAILDK
jgi:hypothetical protein